MDDVSWPEYRDRVRHEHPISRQLELSQQVQDLLKMAVELDAAARRLVRSLSAADYGTLIPVIAKMWSAQFTQVRGPETDYGKWLEAFRGELSAGKVSPERWVAAAQVLYLQNLAETAPLLRQLAPELDPAPDQPRTEPSPEVRSSVQPLSGRLTALRPRIAPQLADAQLDGELSALLEGLQQARDRLPRQQDVSRAADPDWRYVQWWCAQAVGALARSSAAQDNTVNAVRWFDQAAEAWREVGENREVDDCEIQAAQARFAGDGDAGRAIESLLARADEAGSAARPVAQARLLTQAADILLQARDIYGASRRAEEAAEILVGLGFTDPTADVESAFGTWVGIQHREDIAPPTASLTQAVLTAVALAWQKVIQVRRESIEPSHDAEAAELFKQLEQLRLLIRKLGEQARQAQAEIVREAAAAGLTPGAT
jgi:hypothetical protein